MKFGDVYLNNYLNNNLLIIYIGSHYDALKRRLQDTNDVFSSIQNVNLLDFLSQFVCLFVPRNMTVEDTIQSLLFSPGELKYRRTNVKELSIYLNVSNQKSFDKYYSVLYHLERDCKYVTNIAEDLKVSLIKAKMQDIVIYDMCFEDDFEQNRNFVKNYFLDIINKDFLSLRCGDVIRVDDKICFLYVGINDYFCLKLIRIDDNNTYYDSLESTVYWSLTADYSIKVVRHLDIKGKEISSVLPIGELV